MPTTQLFLFPEARRKHPDVEIWLQQHKGELGDIARLWFTVLRSCGKDVCDLLHDGHPTACVNDAAFAYVNVFTAHVNVGFFRGAELADPDGLLHGNGKFMRHVKLSPSETIDTAALKKLIKISYTDMKQRIQPEIPSTSR